MCFRNSKFFKRIQELRRVSKQKSSCAHKTKLERDLKIEDVLHERHGGAGGDESSPPSLFESMDVDEDEEPDIPSNDEDQEIAGSRTPKGLIKINSTTFQLPCEPAKPPPPAMPEFEGPTIVGTKCSICLCNSRYNIIAKTAKSLGFKIVKECKLWNIMWMDSMPGVEIFKQMKRFQQINHFPGMTEICRKDLLSRNLNRMLKLWPKDYKIFPRTWMFPADYGDAVQYSQTHNRIKPPTFIIKPDSGAQGRGIWLTDDIKSISTTERLICQTYIAKPLLIDGYKFDLRVYVLITSVDPLRIYVYNEGLARFATSKYTEPAPDNTEDLFMHLTNYSVNKRSSTYEAVDNDDCGSKRKISAINKWMRRRNYDVEGFWAKVDDMIIKTVLSAWPVLKHHYHACFPQHDKIQACFEVLGFDFLVDHKLRPYILEVNHSPSFHCHEAVDRQVKRALVTDTLNLVSTVLADKRQVLREDRKRVKQRLLKSAFRPGQIVPSLRNLEEADAKTTGNKCPLSAIAQQIAWEEGHMGDYRRIMPPNDPTLLNYYCQFFALQNQASIYSDTAASKKREEAAKKKRLEMEEKKRFHWGSRSTPVERPKRAKGGANSNISTARSEKRLLKVQQQSQWAPGFISEGEERLRRTWMQMRVDTLKNMKIVQMVFYALYTHNQITAADITLYPDLYKALQSGSSIFEGQRR